MAKVFNVLFLCTGNSARSILAEAIINKDGAPHFRGFSAGSQPKGRIHPMALRVLASYGHPIEGLMSKSWEAFSGTHAQPMDFIFTVCDNAAGETCPLWPGRPMTAHWGIADPAAVSGSEIEQERAFVTAFKQMRRRISAFISLPLADLDRVVLATRLRDIGGMGDGSGSNPKAA